MKSAKLRPSPSGRGAFAHRVAEVVRRIPPGTTLSYGEVAGLCGVPGGARAVVRALKQLQDIPWWRVIRADGTLAPIVALEQGRLLRAEGALSTSPAAGRTKSRNEEAQSEPKSSGLRRPGKG